MPGDSIGRSGETEQPGRFTSTRGDEAARQIGGDPSPAAISATFSPAVIEDIQIKAELARYRIRGFGALRRANLGDVRRPHVRPRHAHAHPARRLSRGVCLAHRPGHSVRRQADRARDPAHGHGHELRGPFAPGQDRAGARRAAGRHVVDHRRRRDARRRADRVARFDLRGPAQSLWDQHPAPPPGRRDRADDRPGCQARHRRLAPGLEGLRRDRRGCATFLRASISARRAGIPISSAPTT